LLLSGPHPAAARCWLVSVTTWSANAAAAAELDEDEEEPRLVVRDSTRVEADDEDDRELECRFEGGAFAGGAPGDVVEGSDDGALCRCDGDVELGGVSCDVDADVDTDEEGVRSKLASVVSWVGCGRRNRNSPMAAARAVSRTMATPTPSRNRGCAGGRRCCGTGNSSLMGGVRTPGS